FGLPVVQCHLANFDHSVLPLGDAERLVADKARKLVECLACLDEAVCVGGGTQRTQFRMTHCYSSHIGGVRHAEGLLLTHEPVGHGLCLCRCCLRCRVVAL